MKRLLLLMLCALLLTAAVSAADAQIASLKTDCTVSGDGSCQITQTVSIDLPDVQTTLLLPVPDGARKASVPGYEAQRITQDGHTFLQLASPAGFTGSRTFTVTYTVHGAITQNDDGQQLAVELLCPRWEWKIQRLAFSVYFPEEQVSRIGFSSGYYGDLIEDSMTCTYENGFYSGAIEQPLLDHESLTMTLQLPDDYFSGYSTGLSASWLGVLLMAVLALLALVYGLRTLRSEPLRSTLRSVPPDAALACDLPCLTADGPASFNSMVLHWACMGYLTIHVNQKGHVLLTRRMDMGNERRVLERKLFEKLFTRGDVCDGASLDYKRTARAAMEALERYWQRRLYDRGSGNVRILRGLADTVGAIASVLTMDLLLPAGKLRGLWLVVSFLVGFVLTAAFQQTPRAWYLGRKAEAAVCAAAGAVMLIVGGAAGNTPVMLLAVAMAALCAYACLHGGKRSENGTQMISQALGFRKFLKTASANHLMTMLRRDSQYYYKMLPYALSLGLDEAFTRKFGGTELEACAWYSEDQPLPRAPMEFLEHLRETLALLEISIRR